MLDQFLLWMSQETDPLTCHPLFLIQGGHKQLGQVERIYPDAKHSRANHCGMAAALALAICNTLEKKGRLPGPKNDIVQFSKIHDLGHPPFSHAVEYVLKSFTNINHNEKAVALIDSEVKDTNGNTLADLLRLSGADPVNIKRMFSDKDYAPRKICSDKSIGADKLIYTYHDARAVNFNQSSPRFTDLLPFYNFFGGELGIDIDRSEDSITNPIGLIVAMQYFYFRMYTEVYLSPKSMIYERLIQRGVEHAINGRIFAPEDVWEMSDDVLIHLIMNGGEEKKSNKHARAARSMVEMYQTKNPYVGAISFKYESYKFDRFIGERVETVSKKFTNNFVDTFEDPQKWTKLEEQLSKELKIPILISMRPDAEKVKPANVPLFENNKRICYLDEYRPAHYAQLNEQADAFFDIRINTTREHQRTLSRDKGIAKLFKSIASDYMKQE